VRLSPGGVAVRNWASLTGWALASSLARPVGRFFDWCTGGGRPALAGLVVVVVAVAFFAQWKILAIYLLLILLIAAWRVRQHVVIEEITDSTRDGLLAKGGGAALLAVELARISDAFHKTYDGREINMTAGTSSLEITTSVEDFAANLRSAVTAESKITIGPVGIPVGALMAVLGRLVHAPSITASLHQADGHVMLAARLTGGNQQSAWRIERAAENRSEGATPASIVPDLLSELAFRIFTDVGLRGSTSWQATQHLAEAIRRYRSSMQARWIDRMGLLVAERELRSAIYYDQKPFDAYYDLGVVYQELGKFSKSYRDEAASAFYKAIEIDTTRWEPYYALAQTAYGEATPDGKIEERTAAQILDWCKRVIEMRPGTATKANVFNLIGLVQRQHTEAGGVDAAIRSRQIASRLSLRALARAELLGRRHDVDTGFLRARREQASLILLYLAIAYQYKWRPQDDERPTVRQKMMKFRRIEHVLHLARKLNSDSADLHFEHGKMAYAWRKYDLAKSELQTASQISPRRADIFATLAQAYSKSIATDASDQQARMMITALRHALELTDLLDPKLPGADIVKELWDSLAASESDEIMQFRELLLFVNEIATIKGDLEEHRDRVVDRLAELQKAAKYREAALVCWLLGQAGVDGSHGKGNSPDQAATREHRYREALALWEEGGWIEDVRRYAAHSVLAQELAEKEFYQDAVDEVWRGITIDVSNDWNYGILGDIYSMMKDWRNALEAFNAALQFNPDRYYYWRAGFCLWSFGLDLSDSDRRRSTLAEAAQHLENALTLSNMPSGRSSADDKEQDSFPLKMHYWLGRVYTDAGRPQDAISHLLVASSTRVAPLAKLFLGQAYRLASQLDTARACLKEGLAAIDEHADTIGSEVEDETSRAEVKAWLHEQLAEVSVQRDGEDADSEQHLDQARRYANQMTDEEAKGSFLGECHGVDGRLLLRQGQVDRAILAFHKALTNVVEPEFYAGLAYAYEAKASLAAGSERDLALRLASEACSNALTVDLTDRCKAAIEETQRRLDRLTQSTSIAATKSSDVQPSPQQMFTELAD
jgi:tetratricopeptide (TPR) repeat protein